MELRSPPPCPLTDVVRRNPPRKGRISSSTTTANRSLEVTESRLREIPHLSFQYADESALHPMASQSEETPQPIDTLHVFLRLCPSYAISRRNCTDRRRLQLRTSSESKDQNSKSSNGNGSCVVINNANSITLLAPPNSKRPQDETFEGFARVFPENSTQEEVYTAAVDPLVKDFIAGKSSLLAAIGPTGSGKTHTIFGSAKDPGLVPRAIRHLFCSDRDASPNISRVYYLSMFEICTDKGKREKVLDLISEESESCVQKSSIKGVHEVKFSSVAEAESVVARGLSKRSTAETNANHRSSRSQCVICIQNASKEAASSIGDLPGVSSLSFVDLAGAERERLTGNQGAKLLESNFINKTSMVVGLCLKSLLEHQRNPKKPLEKHFQNSLLTHYLRDYFEGKKRMTLLITAQPRIEDYLSTLLLLRQTSPYMKIRYNNTDAPTDMCTTKRPVPMSVASETSKRRKCSDKVSSMKHPGVIHFFPSTEKIPDPEPAKSSGFSHLCVNKVALESSKAILEYQIELRCRRRHGEVMQKLSRAMWNVLKEYKQKLKVQTMLLMPG